MQESRIHKTILITGAIAGLLAVLLGAFGAHGLKNLVSPASVLSFTTGVRYQMYHAIVLLLLGSTLPVPERLKKRVFLFFLCGILLFSGSIYLLVIDEILGFNASAIAFLTPLGGTILIIGWISLLIAFLKRN